MSVRVRPSLFHPLSEPLLSRLLHSTASAERSQAQREAFDAAVMGIYGRFPLTLTRGKGVWVWDDRGRRYLDCVAGVAVCTLGHSSRALEDALTAQLGRLQHISNFYYAPEQGELARWICQHSCCDRVFFCNSGAEANEAAIKLARKHGHLVRGIVEPVILSARASFHGRTLAAVTATGQPRYHEGFEPMVRGFDYFDYNDIEALRHCLERHEARGPKVAAILLEPLQGEGGIHPGDPAFFADLRRLCDEHRILLILDEIQVGVGRSGRLWGYEHLGIEPDAITLAKGLGGGIPIGALAVKAHCDHFVAGDHGSTFGGNPLACRAGLTVTRELEQRHLLEHVRLVGAQLRRELEELVISFPALCEEVRGWGLIQGLALKSDGPSSLAVVQAAMACGLLLAPAGATVVRFLPPLVIRRREIREAVARLRQALGSL